MVAAPPLVTPPHSTRLLIAELDRKSRDESESPWVSIPIDDEDVSKGYQDITFGQMAAGVNATIAWLQANLPAPAGSFESFAYIGTRDLRYPFLAVAAGKLGYVMVTPSPTTTVEAQRRILAQKNCTIFLYDVSVEERAKELVAHDPSIRAIQAPTLSELPFDKPAKPYPYTKTWEEAKDDPWLVFHTSGTTGHPKVFTYSQAQFGSCDIILGLPGIKDTNFLQYRGKRWLSPASLLHFSGQYMVLAVSAFNNTVTVLPPTSQPLGLSSIKSVLQNTQVHGANMLPATLDSLCADPETLDLLKSLESIHYVGAPLTPSTGRLLCQHIHLAPAIGSTEVGGYFVELPNCKTSADGDWDYITFQPAAGAHMIPYGDPTDHLHELVFIKDENCAFQPLFYSRPGVTRFETKDLWIKHPHKPNQWKIVGRTDDYLALLSGDGVYVAPLEPILREHPLVKTALIGGQGRFKPVILLELHPGVSERLEKSEEEYGKFVKGFEEYVTKANELCHETVKLDCRLLVLVIDEKPLGRTIKDTVSRTASMKLYEREIEEVYRRY